MTPLERHCNWLLRAYPAWYRRERAGEMVGTLLEASPPGARRPSFRDVRALVIGGLRVRGWTWLLAMLWVAAGAVITGYIFYSPPALSYRLTLLAPGLSGTTLVQRPRRSSRSWRWPLWWCFPFPVFIAGFISLRGWRRGSWLRAVAWAGAWITGAVLSELARAWGNTPGVSWGELAICAVWLLLGAVMTWVLAVPPAPRARCVPDNTATGE